MRRSLTPRSYICRAGWLPVCVISVVSVLGAQERTDDSTLRFDAVSIRPSSNRAVMFTRRPAGGFTMNASIKFLIGEAFPSAEDIVSLPTWAANDMYTVIATGPAGRKEVTADEAREMLRAMLRDRFKLNAHLETREQPGFRLVVARRDGQLGPRMSPSARQDCLSPGTARPADSNGGKSKPLAFVLPSGEVAPCMLRVTNDGLSGDLTLAVLLTYLRSKAGRPVVDETGLTGYYRVDFNVAAERAVPQPNAPPAAIDPFAIGTLLEDQLGLKLEPARVRVDLLVVDGIARPTEN